MKRRVLERCMFFVLVLTLGTSSLFSDSFIFKTEINSVSMGVNDLGKNLLPVGTSFSYYKYTKIFKNYRHSARFNFLSDFSFSNRGVETGYDYNLGTPKWYLTKLGQKSYSYLPGGTYFNPRASIDLYIQQPVGTNPYTKNGAFVYFRLGFNSRYSIALENTSSSLSGTGFVFVDNSGSDKSPFGKDSYFASVPWLSGNREGWNNYLYLNTYWYARKYMGIDDLYDGIYGEIFFEYGPWWLANNVLPTNGISSDYWRIYGYLKEYLTLIDIKQANSWNWFGVELVHTNSISYYGGEVVPEQKIPSDRLRATFTDQVYLRAYLPQFIAPDCWSYLQVSLNNNFYFGHVVNEADQSTKAIELQSSLSGTFQLRLFGFLRFQYDISYTFLRGIHAGYPYWSQNAELRFYVSI